RSPTAARVTPRGSSAPAARLASNSRVGRNSLPFIRSKCSLTSAMTGKAAAMMRRSSSATRSRSSATGRWMSPRVAGASCWLMSLRLGERLLARPNVLEPDVHGEHPPIQVARLDPFALLLERPAQPVADADAPPYARAGPAD